MRLLGGAACTCALLRRLAAPGGPHARGDRRTFRRHPEMTGRDRLVRGDLEFWLGEPGPGESARARRRKPAQVLLRPDGACGIHASRRGAWDPGPRGPRPSHADGGSGIRVAPTRSTRPWRRRHTTPTAFSSWSWMGCGSHRWRSPSAFPPRGSCAHGPDQPGPRPFARKSRPGWRSRHEHGIPGRSRQAGASLHRKLPLCGRGEPRCLRGSRGAAPGRGLERPRGLDEAREGRSDTGHGRCRVARPPTETRLSMSTFSAARRSSGRRRPFSFCASPGSPTC